MKMYFLRLYYNLLFLFILISKVKTIDVPIEEVFIQNIKYSNDNELNFNSNKKILLIHILSIDCKLKLEDTAKKRNVKIHEIDNYNYNAFYIKLTQISYKFKISLLTNSLREQNQNKNYRLIINSVIKDDSNTPELNMKENEPVFLYFNEDLKKIILKYKFGKKDLKYPIIISFFIREKINFKIKISDKMDNIIIDRTINYKENIIIKPEFDETYNIFILPEEGKIDSSMIVKIIQNNSTYFYLQKNQLNLGFIPIEIDYYYYYMEVFKGEEGEIMLFNKRKNGILISKIIKKEEFKNVDKFPKYNEKDLLSNDFLEFNIYNQKLRFFSSDTEKCEKGCFLLITYYSNISKSLEINGTEFSILSRIWDEELKSQIINIPLEEYIFGYFNETTVNIHYYSLFIPNETDNVYIEIHGMNILGYYQEGIVEINTQKITGNSKNYLKNAKIR